MKLTEHFNLSEFVISQEAAARGIDNTPPAWALPNLQRVALLLEDVRALLGGFPILISSGWRCIELNKALRGSSSTSAHMQGLAADFIVPGYGDPYSVCKAIESSELEFDQLIHEITWVHLATGGAMRRHVLTIDRFGARNGLAYAR
jgi:hypothetical protein